MTSKLHGVLVTYRRGPQLHHYVESLAAQTRQLDTLLVVDNDPAASARWILDEPSLGSIEVDYLPTGENVGPAGGIARGMRAVLPRTSDDDWLITLDDDDPPRTPELIAELERFGNELRSEDDSVGLVGLVGGRFEERRGRFVPIPDDDLAGPVASSWIGGNNLPFYSVRAVRHTGWFDERLFINMEELDYGLRLVDQGFTIWAHGDLWRREREHYGRLGIDRNPSRSLGDPSWRRYYSLRNLLLILRDRGQQRAALEVAGRSLAKPVVNVHRDPRLAMAHLRINGGAILDAYLGRVGRTVEPQAKPTTPP
jgi:rhamnopyranosyl-N-acetylglucosaminyl-diphospho-decaprenol beta-1,3/1,4-galactofuranosyltransferase